MKTQNFLIANNFASTTSASFTSSASWIQQVRSLSWQMTINSGSLNFTSVQLWVSNDIPVGVPAEQFKPTNWFVLGSTTTLTSGSASQIPDWGTNNFGTPSTDVCHNYMRIVYTPGNIGAAIGNYSIRVKTINSLT